MAIQFSVLEVPAIHITGSPFANFDDFGVSSLLLHEEPRLTQNLEAAARTGNGAGLFNIFCAHWAGDAEPVVAANQLAFLDNRLFGRLGLRIAERPDSALGHEATWRRIDEYLTLLKRLWSNEKPFDHECEFFSVQQGFVEQKGPQGALLPIRMTGQTGTAIQVCSRHATTFDMAFGSCSEVGTGIAKLKESASRFGRRRNITFALHVPDSAIQSQADTTPAQDLLNPYKELGVSEFVFGVETLRRLGAARLRVLKLALEGGDVESQSALEDTRFGRIQRLAN